MMRYRQRDPGEIDAIQWTGDNLRAVQDFMAPESPLTQSSRRLGINNGVGLEFIGSGDWIVRINKALLVYPDARFMQLYEPVEEVES
jgi:hypothetical protein